MPPEIAALIDKPHLLMAVLAAGAVLGMTIEQISAKMRRQAWRRRNAGHWQKRGRRPNAPADQDQPKATLHPRQPDAAAQLRIVLGADFALQPLLNKSEARLFRQLDPMVIACNPTWQVMAQVSLGEILRCDDAEAYRCINSKRVVLLLVDGDGIPRHALEAQGGAHHQGTAAARDAY